MRLRPGDTFDRYVIEALLGEGGMGEVYQARDSRLRRRVALKVLRKEAAEDPEGWQRALVRMLREARAAAALNHPNTVAIYDIGEAEGLPYLAMELIEGLSLRRLIGGGASISTRLGWLLDVARALSAAHRAGLVHRDVKPENVMLREDGTIKVLDFGIARRVHLDADEAVASTRRGADLAKVGSMRGADTVTSEGVMVGTPAYMAPEQLTGDPVDARTDQFGWGVLAYELITGRVPFGADFEGIKLLSAILQDEPPSLEGLVPSVIERVLKRAVAKRKIDRFSSMDLVVDALAPYVAAENAGGLHDALIPGPDSTQPETLAPEDVAPNARVLPARKTLPSIPIGAKSESTPPPRNALATHTMRSPDHDKPGRSTAPPPTPIVRVEMPGNAGKTTTAVTTLESPAMLTTPPPRLGRRLPRWAVVGLSAIWVVAAAVWGTLWYRKNTTPPPVAIPTPAPAPTPITELPISGSSNPEALTAYKEGLQALRDASWEVARGAFDRATKADNKFGSAYLRLALIERFRADTAGTRMAFQRAMELRGTMTERDKVLLDALEPLLQRDPPDVAEGVKRIEEASRRYPGDAEFVELQVAIQARAEPTRLLALADRCIELDPKYADCWQVRSYSLFRVERQTEALASLDRCVELVPASVDCLLERIRARKYLGQCDLLEGDVRRWITKAPTSAIAHNELAVALHAGGQPPPAVNAAVEQAAKRFRDQGRIEQAGRLRIHHALVFGDFEAAERLARDLEKDIAGESLEEKHVVPALALVQLYEELGQDKRAAEVADRFLAQRSAWTRPVVQLTWWDSTMAFLEAKRRGGALDTPGYAAAREAWANGWVDGTGDTKQAAVWFVGYAAPARSEAEAREALAVQPPLQPAAFYTQMAPKVEMWLGGLHSLAGDAERALPHLEIAARSCTALDEPMQHTVATFRLGLVREQRNDKSGACAAYRTVLGRWGRVKGSVTAQAAAVRAKALKCGE
ncbi:serine/threonine-protein kinase [Polyangium sp. 15x6]|uniref:serine/threonine-protein kinase n=1 Tax=Polyangium sp. 15x6 TaxID=3042687 RepID=UPI00249A00FC|nr:serine/threonine-protein kinase [Polyangium sp. 15x6]MDI3289383.1 protein kinase [Polyangium sp. 15x6]